MQTSYPFEGSLKHSSSRSQTTTCWVVSTLFDLVRFTRMDMRSNKYILISDLRIRVSSL